MPSIRHIEAEAHRPEADLLARCFGFTYPPGYAVGVHTHDWDQLIFAASGVMRVFADGGAWLIPPQRALWVPSGTEHDLATTGRVELRTLYFHPGEVTPLGPGCHAIEVSPLLRELILHAVRLGRLRRADDHESLCLAMMRDLLSRERRAVVGLSLPKDPRGLQVARRLLDRPGDDAGVDALARDAGASRRTLERIFMAETGLTVGRWRRRLRLLRAVELLAEGGSVTTVGLRVGYGSTSAFIARFKEMFGVTPGRYHGGFPSPHSHRRTERL